MDKINFVGILGSEDFAPAFSGLMGIGCSTTTLASVAIKCPWGAPAYSRR